MLGGLHRNGIQGETEIELILAQQEGDHNNEDGDFKQNDNENTEEKKKKKRVLKFTDSQGLKTLESEKNLNVVTFDTEAMIDPLFKQTTQKFDEMGIGCLMTSRLNVSSELQI